MERLGRRIGSIRFDAATVWTSPDEGRRVTVAVPDGTRPRRQNRVAFAVASSVNGCVEGEQLVLDLPGRSVFMGGVVLKLALGSIRKHWKCWANGAGRKWLKFKDPETHIRSTGGVEVQVVLQALSLFRCPISLQTSSHLQRSAPKMGVSACVLLAHGTHPSYLYTSNRTALRISYPTLPPMWPAFEEHEFHPKLQFQKRLGRGSADADASLDASFREGKNERGRIAGHRCDADTGRHKWLDVMLRRRMEVFHLVILVHERSGGHAGILYKYSDKAL